MQKGACVVIATLEVQHLSKTFYSNRIFGRTHKAVNDVSLTIGPGQTYGLMGESGCGKSTLGRTIVHLLDSSDGKICFEGKDISTVHGKGLKKLRQNMQIIFQDPFSSLNPHHTIAQSIEEPILLNGNIKSQKERSKRVLELMELVGLPVEYFNCYPLELDPGRLQRVGIARAISVNPKLVVCDEPVSALDVSIQAQILNLLLDLQEKMGLTYIFITHDLSVVHHLSDAIMVMYLGECVEMGSRDQIFMSPLHPYTKSLLSAIPIPSAKERERKVELIKGEITSAIDPPEGCRFMARCPFACPACKEKVTLHDASENHYVSCVLH